MHSSRRAQSTTTSKQRLLAEIERVQEGRRASRRSGGGDRQVHGQHGLRARRIDGDGIALNECIAAGDWRLYYPLEDAVKSVTPADVQRVAKNISAKINA